MSIGSYLLPLLHYEKRCMVENIHDLFIVLGQSEVVDKVIRPSKSYPGDSFNIPGCETLFEPHPFLEWS